MTMRRFFRDAIITLVLVGAAAAVGGAVMMAGGGLGAFHEPGGLEETMANQALHFSIPGAAARAQNPRATEAELWREGVPAFAGRCSMCHGTDGHGQTEIGSRMYPRVPDLGGSRVQEFSDGQLFWIIQSGIRLTGMPGFHGVVTDDDTWKLVAFVRRVPSLTPADLQASHEHAVTGTAVVMDGTRFHPDDLTVPLGSTVTFTNKDFFPHNVQSEAGHLHSGPIAPDEQWSVRLDRPGTFTYVCTLHPGMNGVLHVR
jgi:plastocyanin